MPAPTGLSYRRLMRLVIGWLVNVLAIFVASKVFSSIDYDGELWVLALAGLVLALANHVVRPIVIVLALPAVIVTLGIALLFINALMLYLTDLIVPPFEVGGFWQTVGAALIVWAVNFVVHGLLRSERERGRLGFVDRAP
jgi:putative membrane protein